MPDSTGFVGDLGALDHSHLGAITVSLCLYFALDKRLQALGAPHRGDSSGKPAGRVVRERIFSGHDETVDAVEHSEGAAAGPPGDCQ
jgi:hypothetical protein